ncbi:MAG: hypothetical protein ACOY0T_18255 [Myxococcota bacterium]
MSPNRTRRIGFGLLLVLSPARAASADDEQREGWAHVVDATKRLEKGDYQGAESALDQVPAKHAAAKDAAQVRAALANALGPRARAEATVRTDNILFDVTSLSLDASMWLSPRLQLTGGAESVSLRGPEKYSAALFRGTLRARFGQAAFDASADIAGRYWSDTASFVLGGVSGELFPTGQLRVRASVQRDEELGNYASMQSHVLRLNALAQCDLLEWNRVTFSARIQATRYSDDNTLGLAYAWATYALLRSPLRVELGYAGAYRDTRYSRWDNNTGYFPYMTPLQSWRHGPLASLALRWGPLEVGGAASIALIASERDPTTFGFFESRRDTIHREIRGFLRVSGERAFIQATYEHLQDGHYYTLQTARLGAFIAL